MRHTYIKGCSASGLKRFGTPKGMSNLFFYNIINTVLEPFLFKKYIISQIFLKFAHKQLSEVIMQRFVKTLMLADDAESIALYRKAHDEIWPEIAEGIRSVGISSMEIYLLGCQAVMVMEAPDGLDVDKAMSLLATLPRQAEWERYVAEFQQCRPGDTSAEKWKTLEKVFELK